MTASAIPAAQPDRREFRTVAVTTALIGALLLVGASVFAGLDATASNTSPNQITNGTLKLVMTDDGVGFSSAIANVAPGDQVRRFVTVSNTGTLAGKDLKLGASAAAASKLTTDSTNGLRLKIDRCSVAWTIAGNSCGGVTTTPLASTSFSDLIGATAPGTALTGLSAIAASEDLHLRFTFLLPDQNETTVNGTLPANTIQGLTANMTWTFHEVQRDPTDTSA